MNKFFDRLFNKEAIVKDLPRLANSMYPEVVQQIHTEFHTAADRLLEEAKEVIGRAASKDVNKVARLERLGFKAANQVSELKPIIQQAELSKEQVELVNYYRREYPLYKFITEAQVEQICKKYNLICGDVDRYTGFVPEKNLQDIERFRLKPKEANCLFGYAMYDGVRTPVSFEDAEIRNTRYSSRYEHIFKKGTDNYAYQRDTGGDFSSFYGGDDGNVFGLRGIKGRVIIENSKFKICAPVKDMNLQGMSITNGYKVEKIHIPDPVVLQGVKGGYLIITAWGDEASDPIVVNEINN